MNTDFATFWYNFTNNAFAMAMLGIITLVLVLNMAKDKKGLSSKK